MPLLREHDSKLLIYPSELINIAVTAGLEYPSHAVDLQVVKSISWGVALAAELPLVNVGKIFFA